MIREHLEWDIPTQESLQLLRSGLSPSEVQSRLCTEGIDPATAEEKVQTVVPFYLREEVTRLLNQGQAALRVQDTLTERGFAKQEVFQAVDGVLTESASSRPAGTYPPPVPLEDPGLGDPAIIPKVLGGGIVALGIFLWIGNVSGMFPTVSGLGWGTILIGSIIFGLGQKRG